MKGKAKTVSIILSVTMMFVTVFAIISLTYSWYNKLTRANISSITMSTSKSDGILLSANGTDWSSILSTDGGLNSIDIEPTLQMNSISTSGTVVDGDLQFYAGSFAGNTFTTSLIADSTTYYKFDIYIINSGVVDKQLTLGQDSIVTDVNDLDTSFSVRAAFVNLGYGFNANDVIALDGTGISTLDYIWEPNSTTRSSKVNLYHAVYLPEGKSVYQGINAEASNLILSNNLVVNSVQNPNVVAEVATHDPVGAGDDNNITILQAAAITKIRMFIWCEGQDIDCTNSISAGLANLTFNFGTYTVQYTEPEYIPVESFNATTLINNSGVNYTWSATNTNLSEDTVSNYYIFRISKDINSVSTVIRTVFTTSTSLNINQLQKLGVGEYDVDVKIYSDTYGNSEYSNSFTFEVLNIPSGFVLSGSTVSWSSVTYADSYTVEAYDIHSDTTYIVTTNLLTLNLSTTLFDGGVYLPNATQYQVKVKANGGLGYADSDYSSSANWLN